MSTESSPLFNEEEMRAYRRSFSFRKTRYLTSVFGPMMRVPILRVGAMFWYGVLDEGLPSTVKPRWGILTFHFLNDGFRPTVWHTWMQALGHRRYQGLYPDGAPRNRGEADALIESVSDSGRPQAPTRGPLFMSQPETDEDVFGPQAPTDPPEKRGSAA